MTRGFARRPRADAPLDSSPFDAALLMLGRRELTAVQVRARLLERGYEPDAVDAALERLTSTRALDDERTARAHARTAAQVKGRGRDRILRELSQMGVAAEVAAAAVDEVCGPQEERARLDRALKRKARGGDLSDPAVARRVFAALVRQGFPITEVRAAIRRAGTEVDVTNEP